MKNKILTGESALFIYQISESYPLFKQVAMEHGTNVTAYKKYNRVEISTQTPATLYVGAVEYDENYDIYIPERLFVEFELFMIEKNLKPQIYANLEAKVNPELVRSIYMKLKNKRRGLNHSRILNYLSRNSLNIENSINNESIKPESIIKEYIASILYKYSIPVNENNCGNEVEIFANKEKAYKALSNPKNIIYFKTLNNGVLKPVSRKNKINDWLKYYGSKLYINLSFNSQCTSEQIKSLLKEYKIPKHHHKLVKNGYGSYISNEMILAHKYFNVMNNKSENEMKDILEIALLYEKCSSFHFIKKWILYKFEHYPWHKLDKDGALYFIECNKDREFKYNEINWMAANSINNSYMSYHDAKLIFNKITNKLLAN